MPQTTFSSKEPSPSDKDWVNNNSKSHFPSIDEHKLKSLIKLKRKKIADAPKEVGSIRWEKEGSSEVEVFTVYDENSVGFKYLNKSLLIDTDKDEDVWTDDETVNSAKMWLKLELGKAINLFKTPQDVYVNQGNYLTRKWMEFN